MEYTILKLADMAGVSTRTLRYYDEIGILKPARINSSGYRIYGKQEINRLQQILFYKELGVKLKDIEEIISAPNFDRIVALKAHKKKLVNRRKQLDLLIENVEQSIEAIERRYEMNDKDKFKGFKEKLVEDNEKKYGNEIRAKYGDETINKSNDKIKNMTKDEYDDVTRLNNELMETLEKAFLAGDPAGELAQKAADLHKQWLCYYWDEYSKEAHAGLAQMYVDDERFTAYYDKKYPGIAEFLRDSVMIYTGKGKL